MLLGYKINVIHLSAAIQAKGPSPRLKCSLSASTNAEEYIAKIKNRLFNQEVEISRSSYDTAWMAMVPSREYSISGVKPCFPQCLEWIMENQHSDGSWGLQLMENQTSSSSSLLLKDSLSCTLACLLALSKWNVGQQLVHKGLDFIGTNGWAASDKAQYIDPIGFEIVFPEMINYANQLGLTLPLDTVLVDNMLHCRDSEIKRKQNLEYVSEGLGDSCNWKGLLSRQRRNGSLFNSPATTAAALIRSHDDKCFEYLQSALKTFKNCVPTIYPVDIYARLCIIDTLERLGIDRHFQFEIDNILNETYRLWQRKEEEIFADVTCCAMAFRLLRMREYQVSSDELAEFADEEHFFRTISVQFTGVTTILELNRASKGRVYETEVVLERLHSWTSKFLKQQLLNETIHDKRLRKQVEIALKDFGSMLDRVEDKLNIELYDVDHFQILKTAYRCPTVTNEDIRLFAREDFHICQAQHQKELQQLERWYTDCRLNNSKYGRNIVHLCNFEAAAIIHDPQLTEARMCFAQSGILIARLDDFFDCHASTVEALKLIELVRKWNKQEAKTYNVSGEAEILFLALYDTLNEWAEKAHIMQGRCVKSTLIGEWLELLTCFMREREFSSNKRIITMDEYLSVAWITIAFKVCVNTPAHLLGVKLSEDMWTSAEWTSLCKHASTVARLLNDVQTYKREKGEGKKNVVNLLAAEGYSEEEAISKIQQIIEQKKIQLLHKVLCQTKGSLIPKEYKDFFWMTCKVSYYTYSDGDALGYPQDIIKDMNALIHEQLVN